MFSPITAGLENWILVATGQFTHKIGGALGQLLQLPSSFLKSRLKLRGDSLNDENLDSLANALSTTAG